MVERVNGTIKNDTVLKNQYQDHQEMVKDLARFPGFITFIEDTVH
jgi:hypothetical protein